ncbi:hypothetical protein SEA_FLAGSTAFF_31 [Mycobacterium phage FlagStaff]|uniref:Uncharacterized protein n=1 Tax=Mycobacterium phage FlagStaff TaxID=1647304 RepID=A0A0F6YQ98_9CAUD|nr:recombination directionality factor [Mycobacterium phage FlagStaff]AKF14468.1 hypothetical protein SEA_FLAGSTAFF_31 [Mycobacterium phage FlagStaff]
MSAMTNPTETPPVEELTLQVAAERYGVNLRTLQKAAERGDVLAKKNEFGRYVVDAESVRLYGEIAKARAALADYIAAHQ